MEALGGNYQGTIYANSKRVINIKSMMNSGRCTGKYDKSKSRGEMINNPHGEVLHLHE